MAELSVPKHEAKMAEDVQKLLDHHWSICSEDGAHWLEITVARWLKEKHAIRFPKGARP